MRRGRPEETGLTSLQHNGADVDCICQWRTEERFPEEEPGFWAQMLVRPDASQLAKLGSAGALPGCELFIELKK